MAYSVSEVGETSSFVRSREFQDDEREEGKSDSFQREVCFYEEKQMSPSILGCAM